jgi:hypothetical protein
MKNTLVELRRQAEQAVHDMPDGDLKVQAFETILSHLLSGNAGRHAETGNGNGKAQSKKKSESTTTEPPKSLPERILFLKAEGFFGSQKSIAEIKQELKKNGWHHPVTSMSGPLQSLVQKRELRREHVNEGEGRKGWKYSNW